MKKHLLTFIAAIIFASAISSCSVEYRQRHHGNYGHDHDHDHDHDGHYRNY